MKKIVVLMTLVLLSGLVWADSGTRSRNVTDQVDRNYRVEIIDSFNSGIGNHF